WNKAKNQYTTTIDGIFHRLGKDEEAANVQFAFLMRQAEQEVEVDASISFGAVADAFLDFVEEHHTAERYRHCKERLQEFKDHLGEGFKAKEIRPKHVKTWLEKKDLTAGSERLYKSIIL